MLKQFEIYLKKTILTLFLKYYRNHKTISEIIDFKGKKVLFIRLNRIGDALVTTPLLHLLKSKLEIKIHVLADKKNYFVFSGQSYIDKTIIFKKGVKGYLEFRKNILLEKYDIIVDLHDDTSATVSFLLSMVSNSQVFGLKKKNLNLYTNTIERADSSKTHVVERISDIAKLFKLNIDVNELNIVYEYTKDDIENVNEFLAQAYKQSKPLVGINIIAGNKSRFWGINRYNTLIELLKKYNVNIIIITTPKEIKTAYDITQGEVPIYYSNKFTRISALVSKLDFLFTPDTSIVHLASIYKVPVFGLYVKFKTNDIIWYAYKSEHEEYITEEENFDNLNFELIENKFVKFFEKILNGKRNLYL